MLRNVALVALVLSFQCSSLRRALGSSERGPGSARAASDRNETKREPSDDMCPAVFLLMLPTGEVPTPSRSRGSRQPPPSHFRRQLRR